MQTFILSETGTSRPNFIVSISSFLITPNTPVPPSIIGGRYGF